MQKTTHFLVNRRNIREHQLTQYSEDLQLSDGDVLVVPERFALTANNVTYGAAGEQLGYFLFYPVADKALADAGMVHVPVWGFATVTESKCEDVPVGTRFYGFLPMASALRMTPGKVSAHGFRDDAPHRRELPAVYNQFMITGDSAEDEAWRSLLNPLFATSWMLYDFLDANGRFDAAQVIVSSASSKTAFGLTRMLSWTWPGDIDVIGLTSPGNKAFVEKMDSCDQVLTYDSIADIPQKPSVYIDLAGDTDLRARIHEHLDSNLNHSCAVGTAHWDSFTPQQPEHGPRPQFFFAPSHVKARRNEWGPGVMEGKMEEGWQKLASWAKDHLTLDNHQGFDSIGDVWSDLADGKSDATIGQIINL